MFRVYGQKPCGVVVIHGGPCAPGEMKGVAEQLQHIDGVLEPFLIQDSLEKQCAYLEHLITENCHVPTCIVGWSWGAMFGYLFAARRPSLVKKLILVSSGVFDSKYAASIQGTRMARLKGEDKKIFSRLSSQLKDPECKEKDERLQELARLFNKIDSYDPISTQEGHKSCSYELFSKVWQETAQLRSSGELLQMGTKISCPVVSIHGDYDPHPIEGIERPLSSVLKDFSFTVLPHCGHRPWMEREARDQFLYILQKEIC